MEVDPALTFLRWAVFVAAAAAACAAAAAMLVQRRVLNPFGAPARAVRRLTDPLIRPIERRLIRGGGNPQSAPWWLLGIALVLGILLISAVEWLAQEIRLFDAAAAGGPRRLLAVLVDWAFALLMIALLVRVIGSWFGLGPWHGLMRPMHLATEWLLRPLRGMLPRFGPLDLSPLVAWFLLGILRVAVGRLLG